MFLLFSLEPKSKILPQPKIIQISRGFWQIHRETRPGRNPSPRSIARTLTLRPVRCRFCLPAACGQGRPPFPNGEQTPPGGIRVLPVDGTEPCSDQSLAICCISCAGPRPAAPLLSRGSVISEGTRRRGEKFKARRGEPVRAFLGLVGGSLSNGDFT
jgi:hypothetical protein